MKNGFSNIRHFTDDGIRGTTFKRPGLDAMLDEIRAGNVATVIIKDQSRIGRDVVEVGLLKRTFDEYHVRFIAANDNLDTANGFDINLLCDRADDVYGGRLPVHVRLILDEFANIGQIPNFDKLIATIRSREISASIILQSQSQLKSIYKDAADIISDNCDCTLFLSGRGKNAKEISDALGRETIDSYNTSENRGSQTSHGLNYQKLGKDVP